MILFAWRRMPPPGFIGGAEISEGLIAAALADAGEEITFIGTLSNPRDHSESWRPWLMQLLDHHQTPSTTNGGHLTYRWRGVACHAVPQHDLLAVVEEQARSADVLWTCQEDCPAIRQAAARLPVVSYAHSVSRVGLLSAQIDADWAFAPSRFVRDVIRDRFDVSAYLLRPPMPAVPSDPSPNLASRDHVLFVNPIPPKGVDLALELARRLPAVRFVFVEAWYPVDTDLAVPPNVRLLPRQPTLTSLYVRTQLLLVPSVIEDACPRVVLEAGLSGVPALGSDLGGIPELIADPANLLPPDDPDLWARRCAEILASPADWERASHQQRQHATSLQQDPVQVLRDCGHPLRT